MDFHPLMCSLDIGSNVFTPRKSRTWYGY